MLEELSLERKKELEELACTYRETVYSKNFHENQGNALMYQNYLSQSQIISSIKYLYTKEFSQPPTNNELAMMSLYSILPNDEIFMKMLRDNKYNMDKTAKKFSVPKSFVTKRYKYILEKRKDEINNISINDLMNIIEKTK